ncbi:hypothetical protein A2U01_0068718, partial [Trifolium medium]|nr:hypothetical protein [Trifolium medium]
AKLEAQHPSLGLLAKLESCILAERDRSSLSEKLAASRQDPENFLFCLAGGH